MRSKEQLLKRPNYLLARYQNEIYRQLADYMEKNNLSQRDVAKALEVSDAYISQVLNGEFNFTLKKLIELALLIDKVPLLDFVDKHEYWLIRETGMKGQRRVSFTLDFCVEKVEYTGKKLKRIANAGGKANTVTSVSDQTAQVNPSELCLQ
ncbi:MAG: helix-turn-helix transcriptional regulator [Bacteroidetes bacterium]|nr:helix-turn-helix transcriptional regulator [Bacteroidota bacterium]